MCHVLIIEDEFLIAEHLSHLVQQGGAKSVAIACTEDEAVCTARKHAPDVIVANVRLVEGTGLGAIAAIRSSLGNIPVIFVTGSPEACRQCEAPHIILQKPVDPASVRKAFQQLAPAKS